MSRIRDVVKQAIARKLISLDQIDGYKFPAYKEPGREYLTLAETEKIADQIYEGKLDREPVLKKTACFFLIECYSGIRFSDWKRFEIETLIHDRNLKVRAKKNGEPIYLPLDVFKRLGKIIDYVKDNKIKFDLELERTNLQLKILAKQASIEKKISTHIGRHTCATLLAEKGYSTSQIAQVLGVTEKTAQTYIKHTRQGLDNAFSKFGGL